MRYSPTVLLTVALTAYLVNGCSDMGDPVAPNGNGGGNGGGTVNYSADVQPIINAHCISCHASPANPDFGNLDLTSYDGVMDQTGPNHAPVITPGDPDNSYLVERIEGTIPPQMPLVGAPLSSDQINTIRQWIDEGALDN